MNHRAVRVQLSQIKPVKGDVQANASAVREALAPDADLAVFPETVLSGYFVEGAVREVAISAGELVRTLGAPPPECRCDVALGFYEQYRRGVYNSMAYLSPAGARYEVVHVHRKVFLPTYGLFEERRFVSPGHDFRAFDTRFGRVGMLVCEDMWHSLPASALALDGAEVVLCGAASPARGFGRDSARPGNLETWDRIGARTAEEHGLFVLVAHLVGSEGGKLFAGGSAAWGPAGALLARGPLFGEGGVPVSVALDDIGRVRVQQPLLSDLSAALPLLRRSLDRAWAAEADGSGRGAGVASHAGAAGADGRGDGAGIVSPPGSADDAEPGGRNGLSPREVARDRRRTAGPAADAAEPIETGVRSEAAATTSERPAAEDYDALAINPGLVEAALIEFIREETSRRGFSRVVVGVSGGMDSAVSLFLACSALGPGNVYAFCLPYATSSPDALAHAGLALKATGARARTVSVSPAVDAYVDEHEPSVSPERRGNLAARFRSVVLFDQAAKLGALPLGTGNKSERLLGYYTWHADDSPPINPLGDLFKLQVAELAEHLGVPAEIVGKPPSADLVEDVHDEDELGIAYDRADPILRRLLDGHSPDALVAAGFRGDEVRTVWTRLSSTHWKRELPTVALLSNTAIGESYLRPVDY